MWNVMVVSLDQSGARILTTDWRAKAREHRHASTLAVNSKTGGLATIRPISARVIATYKFAAFNVVAVTVPVAQ